MRSTDIIPWKMPGNIQRDHHRGAISLRPAAIADMCRLSACLSGFGNKAAHHAAAAVSRLFQCRAGNLKERQHDMSAFKGSEALVSADLVIQPKPSRIRSLRFWLVGTISMQ